MVADELERTVTQTFAGYIEEVMVLRLPNSSQHPCGWKYRLHFGERHAEHPIIRYDNAYELSEGHHRHVGSNIQSIEFPGMEPLYVRFVRVVSEFRERFADNEGKG